MNFDLQNKNMYQRLNPVFQNEALVFPQQLVIDVTIVTNHSYQSEGFVAQQPREHLTAFNHEGNQSVEPNGKQLEQKSLRNLDGTRRHETTKIIAFQEQRDRKCKYKKSKCYNWSSCNKNVRRVANKSNYTC